MAVRATAQIVQLQLPFIRKTFVTAPLPLNQYAATLLKKQKKKSFMHKSDNKADMHETVNSWVNKIYHRNLI